MKKNTTRVSIHVDTATRDRTTEDSNHGITATATATATAAATATHLEIRFVGVGRGGGGDLPVGLLKQLGHGNHGLEPPPVGDRPGRRVREEGLGEVFRSRRVRPNALLLFF